MGSPRSEGPADDGRYPTTVSRQLAILGGVPRFVEPLHVGRPNVGDIDRLRERIDGILDRRWFTNNGPVVQEFERALQDRLGVDHVIAVCNGTLGLEIATRAADASGEVIVPSFTFVATAHAIQWQGLTPVFADVDAGTHTIDPSSVAQLITPRTSAIIGVHTWGVGCPIEELDQLARDHELILMYDAAHALGSTIAGRPVGGNGRAEVFSFHATKYVNSFEGGAIATNDEALAERIRSMVNFGFAGYDCVTSVGTNAKMNEVSAAMGLTSLESADDFAAWNRTVWDAYAAGLAGIPGLRLYEYSTAERNSYQYVVVEVGPSCPLSRDELVKVLHAEGCLARRYFFPGVHRMEPYASLAPMSYRWLPNTERLADRVLILPTGGAVSPEIATVVCSDIVEALSSSAAVRRATWGTVG